MSKAASATPTAPTGIYNVSPPTSPRYGAFVLHGKDGGTAHYMDKDVSRHMDLYYRDTVHSKVGAYFHRYSESSIDADPTMKIWVFEDPTVTKPLYFLGYYYSGNSSIKPFGPATFASAVPFSDVTDGIL